MAIANSLLFIVDCEDEGVLILPIPIDSIALLHQYQREVKTIVHKEKNIDYVEVALSDIETANRLAHDILGRTLDELPPQTRKLLKQIQKLVQGECKKQGIEQRDFRWRLPIACFLL